MFHGKSEILAQNDMSVIRNDDSYNLWVGSPEVQCTFLPLRGEITTNGGLRCDIFEDGRKPNLFVFALSWTDSYNVTHCHASLKGSSFLLYSLNHRSYLCKFLLVRIRPVKSSYLFKVNVKAVTRWSKFSLRGSCSNKQSSVNHTCATGPVIPYMDRVQLFMYSILTVLTQLHASLGRQPDLQLLKGLHQDPQLI